VFGAWYTGDLAGACTGESTIHVWQVTRAKQVAELRGHANAVYRAEPIDDETVVSECVSMYLLVQIVQYCYGLPSLLDSLFHSFISSFVR
jgi:hypothetical protein